jgi:hypothetical protein
MAVYNRPTCLEELQMDIEQTETAIAHYHDGDNQLFFTGLRASVLAVFLSKHCPDWTLLEITKRLKEVGIDVNDSTISPRLRELGALGLIVDDGPKRPCRVNHRRKKVWRLAEDAEAKVNIENVVAEQLAGEQDKGEVRS